jgi:hypothetical protein
LANCILTVYAGGTTTPAATFQDIGLVIPAPNPLVADASGRIPLFFVADGSYALRLTDKNGVQSNGGFFYPQIPSIGASSSGGGGTPVDPTTVASTGDLKWRLENTTIAGWVRLNGRTIGNAGSGASERANADCQALFIYIWSTYSDALCPVLGGRGASALADFNAGKQITLLSARGRDVRGLDDMGNAAAGAFTSVPFQTGTATTAGSSCGSNLVTLVTSNLPPYTPAGSVLVTSSVNNIVQGGIAIPILQGGTVAQTTLSPGAISTSVTSAGFLTGTAQGGISTPFSDVPACLLGTLFWKL